MNVSLNTGGVLVVPLRQSVEEFLAEKRDEGLLEYPARPEAVERIPGRREPETIDAVVGPEKRRGD